MEHLFYALGILLSGALIFHFLSQFSISIWIIYFVVAKMWPFMSDHQPWDPIQDKIDEAINGTILDTNFPSLCDEASELFPRKGFKGGKGGKGGRKGGKQREHGLCADDGWKGDPLGQTIVSGFYMVICILLLMWVVFIFARVIRLGRRQQGSAIRTVLHLTTNRLATPAFAAAIFLAWYLAWGFWTWFAQCRPLTSMSNLNLANALLLTVPAAVFTVAWLVGTGCEIAHHLRTQRQDDIPLPNVGPRPPLVGGPFDGLDWDRLFPPPAAAAPGGGAAGVSTTLLLLQSPVFLLDFGFWKVLLSSLGSMTGD